MGNPAQEAPLMVEKSLNSMDLDQKNPGILLGTQPRNSGSCSSQKNPLDLGGIEKFGSTVGIFWSFFPSSEIPGWIFPLFCLLGWGNSGILGFLELDFQEKGEVPPWIWVGEIRIWEKQGEGSGGNFWGSFPFFPPHSLSLGILSMRKPGLRSLGIIPA